MTKAIKEQRKIDLSSEIVQAEIEKQKAKQTELDLAEVEELRRKLGLA